MLVHSWVRINILYNKIIQDILKVRQKTILKLVMVLVGGFVIFLKSRFCGLFVYPYLLYDGVPDRVLHIDSSYI